MGRIRQWLEWSPASYEPSLHVWQWNGVLSSCQSQELMTWEEERERESNTRRRYDETRPFNTLGRAKSRSGNKRVDIPTTTWHQTSKGGAVGWIEKPQVRVDSRWPALVPFPFSSSLFLFPPVNLFCVWSHITTDRHSFSRMKYLKISKRKQRKLEKNKKQTTGETSRSRIYLPRKQSGRMIHCTQQRGAFSNGAHCPHEGKTNRNLGLLLSLKIHSNR